MTTYSFFARALLVCGLLGSFCMPVVAQSDYPNRPVKIIVPFPPGGTTDIMARISAEQLTKIFKQAFVIENISGEEASLVQKGGSSSRRWLYLSDDWRWAKCCGTWP